MTRNRKSLEEQLAEAQAKQGRVKARLAELELRRKTRDHRLRAQGERVLLRLMLKRMEGDRVFAEATHSYVEQTELGSQEREAVMWLMEVEHATAVDRRTIADSAIRDAAADQRVTKETRQTVCASRQKKA